MPDQHPQNRDDRAYYVGDLVAWPGGGLFIGGGGGVVPQHAHYAIQLILGSPDGLKVQSGPRGRWVTCQGALVPSRLAHSVDLSACDWSMILFIEPETLQGRALATRMGGKVDYLGDPAFNALVGELEHAWRVTRTRDAVQVAAQAFVTHLSSTFPHTPSDARVIQAVEYLRAQPEASVSLETLAGLVHLSPSRFRHLFVEQTGMPLRTYQLWRRLLRAWEFLIQGQSISGAAHAAGFADAAHFSRTCRSMFGVAPSAVQRNGPLSDLEVTLAESPGR